MADQAVAELRRWEQSPEQMKSLRALIREYHIPGGSWQNCDEPLSCDGWLQVVDESSGMKNARSTLETRLGTWRKVRAFLRFHVEQSGKKWCCETLERYPQFAIAVAGWAYQTTTARSSVETRVQTMRMAFRMNRVRFVDDEGTRDIRARAKKERTTMTKKKADVTAEHVRICLDNWGRRDQPMWKRQIAIEMGLGFAALGRWSDGRFTSIPGIYWCPEGIVGTFARRKNKQFCAELFYVADTGKPNSLVSMLREYVTDLGFEVPRNGHIPFGEGRGRQLWLFRDVGSIKTKTHAGHREYGFKSSGATPMTKAGYSAVLRLFREMLVVCCGIPEDLQMEWAPSHAGRAATRTCT